MRSNAHNSRCLRSLPVFGRPALLPYVVSVFVSCSSSGNRSAHEYQDGSTVATDDTIEQRNGAAGAQADGVAGNEAVVEGRRQAGASGAKSGGRTR